MKTKLLSFLCIASLMLFSNNSSAQTTLAAGDIVVFWNQTDTEDSFAFATFVNLAENTVIYFTDCGADALGFGTPCTEGVLAYTVPSGGHDIGDIVQYIAPGGANFTTYTDTRITGSFGTSTSGDQILVFQDAAAAGGSSDAANNPQFIFASNTSATTFVGDKTDSNQTGLPNGLSDVGLPRTALGLGAGPVPQDEVDNTVYAGTYSFATIADAKIALTNPANYTAANTIGEEPYATNVFFIPIRISITTLSTNEFNLNEVVMYPNPANDFITISNADRINEVVIFDVTGKEVIRTILTNNQVDISRLNSGMYLVNILGDNDSVIKKLIKQ